MAGSLMTPLLTDILAANEPFLRVDITLLKK